MPETEYAFDLHRILLGKLPWFYVAEVLLRTAVIYIYALFVVRILGKRGMGQLAPFDFVIIIALGSAVGDPMFYPDVPLLHALVAITGIVLFTRIVVHITQRHQKVEDFISATATRLVSDGVMELENMRQEGISREELFEALRASGIEQLGQVERAYLEPSGRISAFRQPRDTTPPGLPLLPEREERHLGCFETGQQALVAGSYGCCACGTIKDVAPGAHLPECPSCGGRKWVRAVDHIRDVAKEPAHVRGASDWATSRSVRDLGSAFPTPPPVVS